MKVLGVIPSRYQSTRFPGKPLVDINGKTMIRRVYEQAMQSTSLDGVWVATDDDRIRKEIDSIGGEVRMTSVGNRNGTERIAECTKDVNYDFIVNIQGDEPYIHPGQIDQLVQVLSPDVEIATLVHPFKDVHTAEDPASIKVVINNDHEALYFSRSSIPFVQRSRHDPVKIQRWKHIGIYAYRKDVLRSIARLKPTPLELAESLEQLRWLENGYTIKVGVTEYTSQSVDTPEDLEKLNSVRNEEN